jgi:hypothetical protein
MQCRRKPSESVRIPNRLPMVCASELRHGLTFSIPGIAVIGIDIDKNSFHIIGQDKRGAIVLPQ